MKSFKNTQDLKSWFDSKERELLASYKKRKQCQLNKSKMIERSIAYHTINEQAIKEGYNLTECQINKLTPLIME